MNPKIKQGLQTAGKFGSATAGLTLGTIAMSKVPVIAALPAMAQKVLPGTLAMIVAFFVGIKFNDEYVKAGAMGIGLAGFANIIKRLTDGQPAGGILNQINAAIPLAGLGRLGNVQNYGGYSPNYFLNSDRAAATGRIIGGAKPMTGGARPINGLRGPSLPYQLSGTNPYALSGATNPYALQGR